MTLTPSEHRNPPDRLSFTRREGIALSLCALLGAALRLYRLDAQSVWYDEAFTVAHSLEPLPDLVDVLLRDAVHPPLHYLIVHAWLGLSGGGAWEARLVSAIVGTLSIPALYLLARRFTDAATSASAALLLAVSQITIYFSQEARPYMVAQFLSLLAAGAFLWLLRRPSFGRTAVFAAASLALMATHYYGIATLAALGLYWLMFRREYSPLVLRSILVAAALVVVAYLPWLLALGGGRVPRQDVFRAAWDTPQRPGLLAPMMALNRFNNGKLDSIEGESPAATVVLGLGIFTLPIVATFWLRGGRARDAATSRRRVQGAVLGCLLAGMPVAFAILLGASGAIFNYRHFSFAVPGYYLAVAIGWRVCFRHPVARSVWMVAAFACRLGPCAPTTSRRQSPTIEQPLLRLPPRISQAIAR